MYVFVYTGREGRMPFIFPFLGNICLFHWDTTVEAGGLEGGITPGTIGQGPWA